MGDDFQLNNITVAGGDKSRGRDRSGIKTQIMGVDQTPRETKETLFGVPVGLALRITGVLTDSAVYSVSAGSRIICTEASMFASAANTANMSFYLGFGASATPTTTGVVLSSAGLAPGLSMGRGDGSGMLCEGADGEDLRITNTDPGGNVDLNVTLQVVPT